MAQAFLLRSSATNQRVTFPAITVLANIGDKVVLDAKRVGTADVILASASAAVLSNPGANPIRWRITSTTGGVEFINSTSWLDTRCTITLERLANNDVSISIPELGYSDIKQRAGIISIAQIFSLNGNFGCILDFYSLKIYNSTGTLLHHYNPSIVLVDPNILVDEIGGNNGTMVNFPSDGSARVPYDDGGGNTEQITTSGGIASTLAGGAASTQIINEQVLSASGIAAAVAAGIASADIVNEQVNSSGGIASAVASASASTSAINEQVVSSGGIAASIAGATASTQVINEQTSEQIVSSGGISASIGSAAASTQVIHEQIVSSGGVAEAVAGGVGVNSLANEQVISTGGTVASFAELVADTQILHEQIIVSSAQAQALASGYANTQIVNEQSGAQIITTGGESAAAAATAASTQFINEQIVSTAGLSQAYFSALLTSVVINRTNVQLAPDRMSATRLAPLITAQYVQTNITAHRLINNITAQRV